MSVSSNRQRGIVQAASNVYSQYTADAAAGTAFVELTASTTTAILITHITRTPTANQTSTSSGNLIIATGAAGSETTIFTGFSVRAYTGSQPAATVYPLTIPIRVPSATRLAGRVSVSDGAGPTIGLVYVNESSVA